jgi:hypothetical protein
MRSGMESVDGELQDPVLYAIIVEKNVELTSLWNVHLTRKRRRQQNDYA